MFMYKQFCIIVCSAAVIYHAFQLTSSPVQPILGEDFNLMCTITNFLVGFNVGNIPVCYITQVNSDGTCSTASCNTTFRYTCNATSYTLTIPGKFNIDVYHGTTWTCQDPTGGRDPSNPVSLNVKVPVTSISITPSTTEIAVGNSQRFTCTTDAGRPNAKIQWYLSDGTNLTVLATQQSDCEPGCNDKVNSISVLVYIGRLVDIGKAVNCIASNVDGRSVTSQNVTISIIYGPSSVVLSPSTLSYTVTENIGGVGPITCTADCRPTCTMTWSGPNLPGGTTSELNIQNIKKNQAGGYRCTARNTIGNSTSGVVTVIVNYGPSSVVFSPSTSSYTTTETTGSVGPITCIADCRPNCTMTWSGPNLPGGTTSVLNIQNIERNHSGVYRCAASNSIDILNSSTITVTVIYGPYSVMLSPSDLSYTVLETTDSIGPITCIADCIPDCTMTWTGSYLPGGTTSVLNLQNINRSQAGDYRCTASNSVGSQTSRIVEVIVNYVPTILRIDGNTTVSENDSTELRCLVDSNPKSLITWKFKDGNSTTILPRENGPNFQVNGSLLKVSPINCLSMGLYSCEANNGIGVTKMNLNVTVMCVPRLNLKEYKVEKVVALKEHETFDITVPILAYPNPWLYWQFQKNKYVINITNGVTNRHNVNRHTSRLIIYTLREEDFGVYFIYGGNGIGNSNPKLGSIQVIAAKRSVNTQSLPSYSAGIGTGLGIAAVIVIITLAIKVFMQNKRRSSSAPNNLYEETESKTGPANIYNELGENTKDGKGERITRCNNTEIPNMYENVDAYDNEVIISEHQEGPKNGDIPTEKNGGVYMNTEI